MADRTRKAVATHNDQDIAGADIADQPQQCRAGSRRTGSMFLNDDFAAGQSQLNFLRFRCLFVRRHTRVADLPALWSARASILRFSDHLRRLSA